MRLTQGKLRQLLHYDPENGEFIWLARCAPGSHVVVGSIAGSKTDGYVRISIFHRLYRAHRLAWLYMTGEWPSGQIDHKDLNGLNNRWDNLREASHSDNAKNRRAVNRLGLKGVHFRKSSGRYEALMGHGGKVRLGNFDTAEDAARAYDRAAIARYGEFARTNFPTNHCQGDTSE